MARSMGEIDFDSLWRPPRATRYPARRSATYYRVRIDLDQTRPPIWRRLDLASSLTLDEVHLVIQAAFPWSNSHLHEFAAGESRWSPKTERFTSAFIAEEDTGGTPEDDVRLDHLMHDPGDRLFYWYDFGDDWHHTIKLEQVMARGRDEPLCRLIAGRRAAPPDDCGGVWGYQMLLEAISDPKHPEHVMYIEWLEGLYGFDSAATYDPAKVDLEALAEDVLHLWQA